jgi:hypothetical protein
LVADYRIVPAPLVLIEQGFNTNGAFQLKLTSTPNTRFQVEASTDLAAWDDIGSGNTDANGMLTFQDPDAPNFTKRFYRASWTSP